VRSIGLRAFFCDVALRRIGKTRHGGNKIANISAIIVNGFKNGFHQWIQRIFMVVVEPKNFFSENFFFGFQNLDALYRPLAGKPFVLEDCPWAWALLWHLP